MAVGDYISEIQTSDRNTHPIGSSFWVSSETWNGKTNTEVENEIKTKFSNLTEITWSDLKYKRDTNSLIPGMQYRITDYITTTTQEDTRSVGYQFDVIVTADSESTLNENASAIQSNSGVIYAGESNTEDLWDKAVYEYDNANNEFEYYSTFEYNGSTYYMWKHVGDDTLAILTEERDYTTNNLQYHNNDFSLTPKIVAFLRNDEEYNTSHNANLTYIVAATSDSIYVDHFYIDNSYFKNIESWELKYCLDNDTTRFAWADETNGKGVIYWMRDEYGNECPYDFKNIQFKRYAVTNVTSTKLTSDALNSLKNTFVYKENEQPIHFSFSSSNITNTGTTLFIDNNNYGWYYTFSTIKKYDSEEGYSSVIEDASVIGVNFYNGEGGGGCFNNKIEVYRNFMASDNDGLDGCCVLNNIVFNGLYNHIDVYNAYSNHIKSQSHSNTFGNNCYSNTFGNNCSFNTFGSFCYSNTFGNNCCYNTFGEVFEYNTFGNNCWSNTFGNNCWSNTFGGGFEENTFGNRCNSNTFGNRCQYNTFGNSCSSNSFGNGCYNNSFGNYIEESQFGDGVWYFSITTQQMTTKPTAANAKNYIRWLIVENGVRFVNVYVTGSTSISSYCQNVRICLGVQGASSSNRKAFDITSCINSKVNNVYQPVNSQTTSV